MSTVVYDEIAVLLMTLEPQSCRRCQAPTRLAICLAVEQEDDGDWDEEVFFSVCIEHLDEFIAYMLPRLFGEEGPHLS